MLSFFIPLLLSTSNDNCPLIKLQSNPQVNISEYSRASWYVHQQQINGYQRENDLNCVVATYNRDNHSYVPHFSGEVLSVYNYANSGKVNGNSLNSNSSVLCARIPNKTHPEKLVVSPCFLPNFFSGPYWILSVGPRTDYYEWAIVIGGQPTVRTSNTTCTTKERGYSNSGLWIFSRNQTIEDGDLQFLRSLLEKKGISNNRLRNVNQTGCVYNGAFIKS